MMMADHAEHTQNRGPAVLGVTTALLVASSIFVALRLVSRAGVVRKVSRDDYFIILAWVRSPLPLDSMAGRLIQTRSLHSDSPSPSAMELHWAWGGMKWMCNRSYDQP